MTNLGVGYVPADRHRFGLVLSFIGRRQPRPHRLLPQAVRPRHRPQRRRDRGTRAGGGQGVRHPDAVARRSPPGTLSGGNQQKIVVARELDGDLRLLVLDQPTRGLDVGSIEFIHRQAIKQARRRDGRAARLRRARRGPRAERPGRGHVPRPDRRGRRRPDRRSQRGRRADGDRCPPGGRGGERRHHGRGGGREGHRGRGDGRARSARPRRRRTTGRRPGRGGPTSAPNVRHDARARPAPARSNAERTAADPRPRSCCRSMAVVLAVLIGSVFVYAAALHQGRPSRPRPADHGLPAP